MKYFSYHTHSLFCDGNAGVQAMCESAIEQGLNGLGFASHAPLMLDTSYAMKLEDLQAYVEELEKCRHLFQNRLKVYRALEADYITNDLSIPFDIWRKLGQLDYIIGSVHLVSNPDKPGKLWFLDGPSSNYDKGIAECFDGNARWAVERYYAQIREMVQTQEPDVIAHVDKVVMNNKKGYFAEMDTWYQNALEETLQVIAASSAIVEINTRGIYRGKYNSWFPNKQVIRRCVELGIALTVSVDAHSTNELRAGFKEAVLYLQEAGSEVISVFEQDGWKQIPIIDVL
ncbi:MULTISPECIES: histidinol-phosphatase [unclassified Carboxylicivirga]|uniref:histidinol-phosphatase n=1 Tax=Carboxylicivirga TaxID=1628153 RepID=UPI003D34CDB1